MSAIVCPNCGVADHLSGQRDGELLKLWEKARGDPLSTAALRTVYRRPACDADTRAHFERAAPHLG